MLGVNYNVGTVGSGSFAVTAVFIGSTVLTIGGVA